ncbi:hypothetical protein [Gracilibacillus xinjiangensis]|uniref:Uncharacterized protein n=1 Tax=Gracilibacillus xinjiangensis TaxID=1193282 RepID=A0ABV8WRM5_9BACI
MKSAVNILGIPFSKLTLHDTAALLEEHINNASASFHHLNTINSEISFNKTNSNSKIYLLRGN